MSVAVTVNNVNFTIPSTNDRGWGAQVTSWIQTVSSSTLQKSGGTFSLTADVDFGASYGLKSIYYKSRSADVASAGIFRLGNAELIASRNAAADGNVTFGVTASDVWQASSGLQLSANASCTLTSASTNFIASGGLYIGTSSGALLTNTSTDLIIGAGLRLGSAGGPQISASGSNTVVNGNLYIGTSSGVLLINSSGVLRVDGGLRIGSASEASAIADFNSTTKGFLPPRMSTAQKEAISAPATGLVVFDTDLGKLCVFSTTWQTVTSS